jgi:type IV pilus assembly protein PilV
MKLSMFSGSRGTAVQRGVSLIEVLVAVVILAIGLLGLAGLQAGGLRVGQGAMYRGVAAQYAYDMADRMRANMAAAKAGQYSLSLGATFPVTLSGTLVTNDVNDWMTRMRAALPGADGSIAGNQALNTVTGTMQWDDRRAAARDADPGAAQAAQFTVTTQLWND